MEKSAIISVRSFSDLNKDEVIEVVTPGKFHLGESEFKAVYEESEISGMDGTFRRCTVSGSRKQVLLEVGYHDAARCQLLSVGKSSFYPYQRDGND